MSNPLLKKYLPDELYFRAFENESPPSGELTEVRIRHMKPVIFVIGNKEYGVKPSGGLTRSIEKGLAASPDILRKTVELVSGYSLYAWEDEVKAGFITLPGGHRVGICGKVIMENDKIKTISSISSVNMRISHEITGCADKILDSILNPQLGHIMIISPPGCGKTTLIRDLARNISNGVEGKFPGRTVAIADERSEIAGCYMGKPQNDVGIRTDVLDRCPKHRGMNMLLRGMAPEVIIADEIGSEEDIKAIENIVMAGVKIICTVHGSSVEDIRKKKNISYLTSNELFDKYIVLSAKDGPGTVDGLYNKDFTPVLGW